MTFVEYIYNPQSGSYGIDLGYTPSTDTRVRIKGKAAQDGGLYFGMGPEGAPSDSWFRLFSYEYGVMTFDCPNDSDARIEVPYDAEADFFDLTFGFKSNGEILFLKNNLTSYEYEYSTSSLDFDFDDTLKCWGNANYSNDEGSRFYEIWIYETAAEMRHFLPAYDDIEGAGLYETYTSTFYGAVAGSDPIDYQSLPGVVVEGKSGRINVAASGTSISGSVNVYIDLVTDGYYWEITEISSTASSNTITIGNQTGLHYYSGNTTGTTNFEIVVPVWDGTGPATAKGERLTHYAISTKYANGDTMTIGNTPFTFLIRQRNPNDTGKPLYLGESEVSVAYLGGDSVIAAYLGEDLVFEG